MSFASRVVLTVGVISVGLPWAWTRYASSATPTIPIPSAALALLRREPAVHDAGTPAVPMVSEIHGVIPGFEPRVMRLDAVSRRFVSPLPGGGRAVLTVEPTWQRAAQALLARHQLPRASVVVLDTETGRVLVYASHGGDGSDLARNPAPPAASVFKIVTSSALLQHGLTEAATTCWSGGFHALTSRDLVFDPRRDRECSTLAEAFAHSTNTVFARRALEFLRPDIELATAQAWGFGRTVPFDVLVPTSGINIPTATLPFARTAAGFWNSHLSPLHGALLAQGIARRGEMLRPWLVERVENARGQTTANGARQVWQRAVPETVADALGRAMLRTVSDGTAFHGFHDEQGRAYLPDVVVGGKTGTLNGTEPNSQYTWFVGNAEGSTRRLSFAVMVANGPLWRVKAPTLARQVLQIAYRGRATD